MPSGAGQSRRTIAGAIKGLFKAAVKAVTQREEAPQPETRRRAGEKDGRGFARVNYDHRYRNKPSARGRFAKLRPAKATADKTADRKAAPKVVAPAAAYASTRLYLSNTLDWLNLWQDNANNEQWHDADFSAKQDQYFPQP